MWSSNSDSPIFSLALTLSDRIPSPTAHPRYIKCALFNDILQSVGRPAGVSRVFLIECVRDRVGDRRWGSWHAHELRLYFQRHIV